MKTVLKSFLRKHLDDVVRGQAAKDWGRARSSGRGERFYLTYKNAGISFAGDGDRKVIAIFLNSDGYEGQKEFVGELPGGVSFDTSRQKARKKFGKPTATFGGEIDPILGMIPPRDRYDFADYSVAYSFSEDEKAIVQVTIMSAEAVPGRTPVGG